MTYTVKTSDLYPIDQAPENTAAEICRNVAMCLCAVQGSVPMDRKLGVAWNAIDMPTPRAKQRLINDVMDAIEYGEPRCEVESVEVSDNSNSMTGKLELSVKLYIPDEYLSTRQDYELTADEANKINRLNERSRA